MNLVKFFVGLATAVALTACGGGGGNPGTSGSTATTGTSTAVVSTIPKLTLDLLDDAGTSTNSISATGTTTLKATLKNVDGSIIGGKIVSVTADVAQVKFPDGSSAVTGASNGVALLKVGRASISAIGAGNLTVTYSYTTVSAGVSTPGTVSETIAYQLSPLNVGLTGLDLGTTALPAYGNRPVSVKATINGVVATGTAVQVTFSASCGTITPASATTDASGVASATYSASLATCAGTNVQIAASAVGATAVSGTVVVSPSIATNVQFISTTPQLIYLQGAVGTTQAQSVFKVIDSSGNPLQNQKLRLSLNNIATGVSLNTIGNTGAVDLTSDSQGLVSLAVFSGTVPTSLNIRATLLDDKGLVTSVSTDSNLLTVASGRPTQKSLSLSVGKRSIEGLNVDGQTTTVTLSMADRQGNPVPPGTQVNFVTESGVFLPAVCFVPPVTPATATTPALPTSSCTVTLVSSGTRTANGRVSILAYVAGEEDFIDNNGDNIFNSGDTFTDLGRAYRDDNGQSIAGFNGAFSAGEFQVPRVGSAACTVGNIECPGDGVWGEADVRKKATVVYSSSKAEITTSTTLTLTKPAGSTATATLSSIDVTIADEKNNSMPSGSTVDFIAVDDGVGVPGAPVGSDKCSVTSSASVTLLSTLEPSTYSVGLKACTAGDQFRVRVTTPLPLGTVTERTFSIQ